MPNFPIIAGGESWRWQWRDRYGRWVEMGRGVKFKMRLSNGSVESVIGKFVGPGRQQNLGVIHVQNDPNGLPDGFYEVDSANGQEIVASLSTEDLAKRGIELGKHANGTSISERADADIPDQADLIQARLDAPTGWTKNEDGSYTSEDGNLVITPSVQKTEKASDQTYALRSSNRPAPQDNNEDESEKKPAAKQKPVAAIAEGISLDRAFTKAAEIREEQALTPEKRAELARIDADIARQNAALIDASPVAEKRILAKLDELGAERNKLFGREDDTAAPQDTKPEQQPTQTEAPTTESTPETDIAARIKTQQSKLTPKQRAELAKKRLEVTKDRNGNEAPEGWNIAAREINGAPRRYTSADGKYEVEVNRDGSYTFRKVNGQGTKVDSWEAATAKQAELDSKSAELSDMRKRADAARAKYDAERAAEDAIYNEALSGELSPQDSAKKLAELFDNENGDLTQLIDSGATPSEILAKLDEISPKWKALQKDYDERGQIDLPKEYEKDAWRRFEKAKEVFAKLDTAAPNAVESTPEGEQNNDKQQVDTGAESSIPQDVADGEAGSTRLERRGDTLRDNNGNVVAQQISEPTHAKELRERGKNVADLFELDKSQAELFRNNLIEASKSNKFGASVTIHDLEYYQQDGVRLFVTQDGLGGVAINGDEIISGFMSPEAMDAGAGSILGMVDNMVDLGGRRLDAFDTILPELYAEVGFKPVARLKWNDEYAPTVDGGAARDWNKEDYAKYNNGEPDVVFMAYDPEGFGSKYDPSEGPYVDEYDQGTQAQLDAIQDGAAPQQLDVQLSLAQQLDNTDFTDEKQVQELADAFEKLTSESQAQAPVDLDFSRDIEEQIQAAIDSNTPIRFFYNGKVREFVPEGIKDGKDGNRNVVFHSEDASRPWMNFTIGKMEPIPADEQKSEPVDLTEADIADEELSKAMSESGGVENPDAQAPSRIGGAAIVERFRKLRQQVQDALKAHRETGEDFDVEWLGADEIGIQANVGRFELDGEEKLVKVFHEVDENVDPYDEYNEDNFLANEQFQNAQEKEELANLLGHLIGIEGMGYVFVDDEDPNNIVMDPVGDQSGAEALAGIAQNKFIIRFAELLGYKNADKIGLLDVLIGNADRHRNNWRVDLDVALPIDHGGVYFGRIGDGEDDEFEGSHDDFINRDEFWRSVYQDGIDGGINPVFSKEWLQDLRSQLVEHARPLFDEKRKREWFNNVIYNLDLIIDAAKPEGQAVTLDENNNYEPDLVEGALYRIRDARSGNLIEVLYLGYDENEESSYPFIFELTHEFEGKQSIETVYNKYELERAIRDGELHRIDGGNQEPESVQQTSASAAQEQVIDSLLHEKNVSNERKNEIQNAIEDGASQEQAQQIINELVAIDNQPNAVTTPRSEESVPELTGPDGETFVPQYRNEALDANRVMEAVRQAYPNHVVLKNGDIIVESREHDGKRYDVIVRRTESERFFAYVRETDLSTGSVRAIRMGTETHSAKALNSHINGAHKLVMAKKNPTIAVRRAIDGGKYHYENGGGQGDNFDPLNNLVQEYIDGINLTADQENNANRAVDALSDAVGSMFQFDPSIVQNVRDFALQQNLPSDFVDTVLDKLRTMKLRQAGLVNLPDFADRPTHQDTDGNALKPGDWVDWTSPEGKVFRAQVRSLRPISVAVRGKKDDQYEYTDYVYVVSAEYDNYRRSLGKALNREPGSQQYERVSSGLKKVSGPDAPKSKAWDQKRDVEAANQENIFTPAKYGVPENPAAGEDPVTIPRQGADLPNISEANISYNENGVAEVSSTNSNAPVSIIEDKGQLDAIVAPLELKNANSVDDYLPGDILVGWNEDGSIRYDQIVSVSKDENGALTVEKFVFNSDGNGGQLKTMKLHGAVLPSYYRPEQQADATKQERVQLLRGNFNSLLASKQMSDTQRAEYQQLIDGMDAQNYEGMRAKLLEIANFKNKEPQTSTPQEKLDASASLAREIASAPGTPEVAAGQLDAVANQSEKLSTSVPAEESNDTTTPEIPELPVVKSLTLREAKVRARAVAESIRDRELPASEVLGGGLPDWYIKRYRDQILDGLIKDGDRRRDKGFNEALDNAIEITKNFGWFDIAAELTAIRARKDKIALREGSTDFNANVQALVAAYPEWINLRKEIEQADVARWFERGQALRDLRTAINALAVYPDVYNKKFRAALSQARQALDSLTANVAEVGNVENAGLANKIDNFKRYFDAFGELPALPKLKYSGDDKQAYLAGIAQQLQGLSLEKLRNGVGDWRLTKNISDGINGLHLMENSNTGEQILIKYDNDNNKYVDGVFVGNGIKAEEMVAVLYRDLGFASPAVAVINPDDPSPELGGLAVMEFANDGFFGLQDIQQARWASANNNLVEIAPEHRAEILNFLVANGIIGNTDRHRKNYMFGQDPATGYWRIVPIDNGLAFFNGKFNAAERNADDPLYLRPDMVISGQYGNRNGAAGLASQWVTKIGIEDAKSQIIEFAQRMQKRAEILKFRDERANGYISARAQWIIDNIDVYLDAIMTTGRW